MSILNVHPANIWPDFGREEFEALQASIKAHGQLVPIVLCEGQILDGKHRYRACVELGIEPQFRTYDGPDPLGHTLSLNMRRSQLSVLDLAQLALRLLPRFEKAAAQNSAANLKKGTNPPDSASGRSRENQAPTGKAAEQAAKVVGVSARTVERVAYIMKYAPSLIPDIKAGLLTIPQAGDRMRAMEDLHRTRTIKANQAARRAAKRAAKLASKAPLVGGAS